MKKIVYFSILSALIISACSSSQNSANQKPKEQEIYVFDDASPKNNDAEKEVKPVKEAEKTETVKKTEQADAKKENPPVQKDEQPVKKEEKPVVKEQQYPSFIVQLGAFSSKDKAEKFVSENKTKLTYELKISYSETVKLFVVQLPQFSSRAEAEKVRNKLWETAAFKDAFIVTLDKK